MISKEDADALAAWVKQNAWCAVSCLGAEGKVPLGLGDNVGGIPVMFSVSANPLDTAAASLDRTSPIIRMRRHFRLWCPSRHDARALEVELPRLLHGKAQKLRGGWWSIGEDLDTEMLQIEVEDLAKSLGIRALDDATAIAIARHSRVGDLGSGGAHAPT